MNQFQNTFFIVFCLLASSVFAQMFVTNAGNNNNINYLVNEVLIESPEDGDFAFNITVNGAAAGKYGFFSANNTSLGISEGLIMSTGGIGRALDPPSGALFNGNPSPDPDLNILFGEFYDPSSIPNMFNKVVIEFDFFTGDTLIAFEYIFASEEYEEYTCSSFNDVFGFFLSGPGINGPYQDNAVNLALVPEPANPSIFSSTPVTINSVNGGLPTGVESAASNCAQIDPDWQDNSIFFVNNSGLNGVGFNGFTTPLRAVSEVECGEVYHIKLVIADVFDQNLGSAVFLRKGSFDIGEPLQIGLKTDKPYVLCEGELLLNANITGGRAPIDVEFEFNGEVIPGEELLITEEGTYTVRASDDCGVVEKTISAVDYEPMELDLPDTVILCFDTLLSPDFTGGAFPLDIQYSSPDLVLNHNELDIPLFRGYNGRVELTITDDCGFTVQDNMVLITPPRPTVDLEPVFYLCESKNFLSANVGGGYGELNFYWILPNGDQEFVEELILGEGQAGRYTFVVEDDCGFVLEQTVDVFSASDFDPLSVIYSKTDFDICNRDFKPLPVSISGGVGGFFPEWYVNGELIGSAENQAIDGSTLDNGRHSVLLVVKDACGDSIVVNFSLFKEQCEFPNIFTPNADNINDGLYLPLGDLQSNVQFQVFDRWGNSVYQSDTYERCTRGVNVHDFSAECWNGTLDNNGVDEVVNGVYFFTLDFQNGTREEGNIVLMR